MSTSIIKINRGDTFYFPISVTDPQNSTKKHILAADEAVYFALLYPHQPFEKAFVLKGFNRLDQNLETGEILVKLASSDTKGLTPGVYYYTVKFQKGGDLAVIDSLNEPLEVKTLVERTKFIINE